MEILLYYFKSYSNFFFRVISNRNWFLFVFVKEILVLGYLVRIFCVVLFEV